MRRVALVVGVAVMVTLGTSPVVADARFAPADAAMRARVRDDGLPGGVLLVRRGDDVVHRFATGRMTERSVIPIASASKWLTAATVMTFVDEGRLRLDDPVSRYLAGFDGAKGGITVRQLLSHRSGLPAASCEGDPADTLARCAREIATGGDPVSPPGREFHYSGVGFVVAGRLIERLSGLSFEAAFEHRIARPLGMAHTRFDGTGTSHTRNPAPAASARSSVHDYARFLRMLAADGTVDGRTVLQPASVREIERDQVAGLDTSGDDAVQITHIPTYGLGVWRDEVAPDDTVQVVSGSGALGFYPWIDRVHGTSGIVAVDDEVHGPEHAVPASQRIARMLWEAAA
jgi:CubicO group peptidase (beta-lactamase class C family)